MTSHVLLSCLWSIAGLIVGYVLGRAGRIPLPETPVPDTTTQPHDTPTTRGARTRQRRHDSIAGVALVVLAIASVTVTAVHISGQQHLLDRQQAAVTCQNAYNTAVVEAQDELHKAAALEREGQRKLLAASFAPERTKASVNAAYRAYLDVLAQADRQRGDNPLPPLPRC
ncbi:hypothetical protein [Pseudonocardia acaciae]|uniref:hypothetical protein n=1 Tax=Pseudonocardia acaciae TaxID=551276 RepID=UPI00048B8D3B|nr:hypothetical protein [Pseudonocardia acaciae]